MQVSVIIPVWNGAGVVGRCLDALAAQVPAPAEIICVDNASVDDSADVVAARPGIRLLRQAVNLGFAGGVNVGLAAAGGDLLILLNQDCLVRPGWLAALSEAAAASPGVLGCTIYHADGVVDHRGALMKRPMAYGEHLTAECEAPVRPVDYVTGAAFAVARQVWQSLGPLDDGFYPGYYEDADYCYRARRKGFPVACSPKAEADHLRSGRGWMADPLRHWSDQHRCRYRFVTKHWAPAELSAFFALEADAIAREPYADLALGRLMACRDTVRALPDILARRAIDLGEADTWRLQALMRPGFAAILRSGMSAAGQSKGPS